MKLLKYLIFKKKRQEEELPFPAVSSSRCGVHLVMLSDVPRNHHCSMAGSNWQWTKIEVSGWHVKILAHEMKLFHSRSVVHLSMTSAESVCHLERKQGKNWWI